MDGEDGEPASIKSVICESCDSSIYDDPDTPDVLNELAYDMMKDDGEAHCGSCRYT